MDLKSYLDENGVQYQWETHPTTYTAQDLAHAEHVSGHKVIKPVLVQADGRYVLCALPASHRVDLESLRQELRAEDARLADEQELRRMFGDDCELGAEPPIGSMFDIPMIMDESLFADEQVTFQAGTHEDAVTMSFFDFFRLAKPTVGHFGRPA